MKDKRNRYGAIAMAQRLRNNIFVNLPPLPLLCEISGALHLRNRVLRQAGWQTKYRWISNFSKLTVGRNFRLVASFNQGTASLQPYQCIPAGFSGKAYCKVDFKARFFSGSHTISHQSLLLSTTVLNNIQTKRILL